MQLLWDIVVFKMKIQFSMKHRILSLGRGTYALKLGEIKLNSTGQHINILPIKRLVTCSSGTHKLYTEGVTELFMNEMFTCNSMKLKIVIITFYGNGLFVLLDDIIVDQCY